MTRINNQTSTSTLIRHIRTNWKYGVTIAIVTAIGLIILVLLRQPKITISTLSNHCDVEAIIRKHNVVQDTAETPSYGCTFARRNSTSSQPPETNWCMYDDEVDLRVVIMTYNRWASLLRLLRLSLLSITKN